MDAGISGMVHMENMIDNSSVQPDNAKTRQATRYGVRLFREYCSQHGVEAINNLPALEIARMLKGFYGQARTKDGQRFSVNSLIAIRYAISRYYRSPMVHRKIDIVKDNIFNEANETFRSVLKDLEKESRGTSCQKELLMVDMDDRRKLRHYFEHAISTPRGLLQKVWYDLMLRTGRRGRESQRLLNRSSFRIGRTADGRQYIYQVDDVEGGIIMEIPGDPLCPVKTLKFYLARLNPACRALFQRPKEHVYEQDMCWYVNSPVGKNMLATMMSTISKCARLSRVYTNVRIRATTYSPADGNGCIPCTSDNAEISKTEEKPATPAAPSVPAVKVEDEKKKVEVKQEIKLPVPVSQNSQIIMHLKAPVGQHCFPPRSNRILVPISTPNSIRPVSNTGSGKGVFPVALTLANPRSNSSTPSNTSGNVPQKEDTKCVTQCDWCKKELNCSGGILLTSNEVGKEYCSTECLGKWIASESPQQSQTSALALQTVKAEPSAQSATSNYNSMQPSEHSSTKIQKLINICSSPNLLPFPPSISTDYAGHQSSDNSDKKETKESDLQCDTPENSNTEKFRSSSPQLIVPDEVPPAALVNSTGLELENDRKDEVTYKDMEVDAYDPDDTADPKCTCDREIMCQPSTNTLAILCKPVLKSQAIQTDFFTDTSSDLMGKTEILPRIMTTNGDFFCRDDEFEDSEIVDDDPMLNGDELEYFDDGQDTSSLRMFVEEDDDDDEALDSSQMLPVITQPEESVNQDALAMGYAHRGRTTKRTTWDEIAQRSKLQTLWGVKVFREWLQAKGTPRDFENLEGPVLASLLEEFYENLTKPDGEEYSVSTMHTIRASISRYLTLPPHSKPFSIIRDREFKKANEAFYRRIRRLQGPRQIYNYAAGRTMLWQPLRQPAHPPPAAVSLPCNTNGIMLVRLGSH